jgi:predicted ArsR family transcriptional regulator
MDRLEAVGDPGLRSALTFVRGEESPVSADDLAAHDRIHRSVARSRLERLAAAGLVETGFSRRTGGPGAGRPAKTYSAAPELAAVEFPDRHYATLVGLLAEGRSDLREVGLSFGRGLARQAGLRRGRSLDDVCTALRSLGFQASHRDGVIVTPTCPLRPLVVARPEAAEIDRGMWEGLVGAARPGAVVTCAAEGCRAAGSPCHVRVEIESRR